MNRSQAFSPVGVQAPRGQFQEYLFARSSKASLPALLTDNGGNRMDTSCIKNRREPGTVLYKDEDREIIGNWSNAVRQISMKEMAWIGEASPNTVLGWRQGNQVPNHVKAMRIARRVPLIKAAILETLGVEMPAKDKVIARLLCSLADIIADGDEFSARRARLALSEFAEGEP